MLENRRLAKPISYLSWRRSLLDREPNATIQTQNDERGVVAAAAFVDQVMIATWALVSEYNVALQSKEEGEGR